MVNVLLVYIVSCSLLIIIYLCFLVYGLGLIMDANVGSINT